MHLHIVIDVPWALQEGRSHRQIGWIGQQQLLEHVALRSCGYAIPGSVQGQVGWSSEQPGLVEGVPAYNKRD